MKSRDCALAAMLIAAPIPAMAQTDATEMTQAETPEFMKTGRAFLKACDLPDGTSTPTFECAGMVEALAAAVDAADYAARQAGGAPVTCIPSTMLDGPADTAEARIIADGRPYLVVVLKFIRAHPERQDNAADDLVVDALRNGFPCRHGTKP